MEKITGNELAGSFSYIAKDRFGGDYPEINAGLTIRQYFAGLAMQALCAHEELSMTQISKYAVEQADDLIKTLNKTLNPNE